MTTALPSPRRLPPQPGEQIDRGRQFTFTFDGRTYTAHPGDTIASALAAGGVDVLSRSFKYHRPRGLLCCAGHCPNCLVQVGSEPNVRACTRPAEPEMRVSSQNAWPSLDRDAMALTGAAGRLLPPGFYYKAFVHPRALWPVYERVLRRAAGLGAVDPATPPGVYDKQYLHADVVVIGGGPAGLSAALAAAESGARVILADENPTLGGHRRYAGPVEPAVTELIAAVLRHDAITVLNDTTVLGAFEENWLAAVTPRPGGERLFKIRGRAVIYATGAYEQPLLFDNNDLPGIMLGSAVQRLIRLYGVAPGRRAVVVTANEDGWQAAADLLAAGIEVAALVDLRANTTPSPGESGLSTAGVSILRGYGPTAARGGKRVREVVVAPLNSDGQVDTAGAKTFDCDLVVVSVGWAAANGLLYQSGGRMAYDEARGEFLPDALPAGVFAAGRVAGAYDLARQTEQGRLRGRQAARYAGCGAPPEAATAVSPVIEPRHTDTTVRIPGRGKRFLCYCEDVTDKDLEISIAEGYDSLELLKRYSTISMGPCQGKMCSQNTIHLCARVNGRTVAETGTTTARPPATPVSLGALAGQHLEPVQLTPIHHWHQANGAKMMVAGLWLRPEHYGNPTEEVLAVRRNVGLIDVSTLGKFRLTGAGVPELLEKIYINRWRNLGVGRVRYGVMCNDEGVILDDGVTAHVANEEWYMTTTSSGSGAIFEWLQWWLQSGWGQDVHAVNVSEVHAAFNLAGPRAREVLAGLTDCDLANAAFPYMQAREATVAGVPCRLLRIGFTGELSYEIHCPAGYGRHVWESILEAGRAAGIRPFGVEAQRILRLEKAHLIVGQDTDGLTDPVAADMELAVKLDKPDFLGQRAISRVKRDSPRQRLVGFVMATPDDTPDEGLQIMRPLSGGGMDIAGWVTSSRYSPTLQQSIGLCWLDDDLAQQPGQVFHIRRDGRLVEARVHHGPFYDPQGERLRG